MIALQRCMPGELFSRLYGARIRRLVTRRGRTGETLGELTEHAAAVESAGAAAGIAPRLGMERHE